MGEPARDIARVIQGPWARPAQAGPVLAALGMPAQVGSVTAACGWLEGRRG